MFNTVTLQYITLLFLLRLLYTVSKSDGFGEIPSYPTDNPPTPEPEPEPEPTTYHLPCVEYHATSVLARYFALRNLHSGLVLEGTLPYVKLRHFTGADSQLWRLEVAEGGQFYIINKANGKVLDVENWKSLHNTNIVLRDKEGVRGRICPSDATANATCQKWFIHYKSVLVNACGPDAIDVLTFTPETIAHTRSLNSGEHQIFDLQYI